MLTEVGEEVGQQDKRMVANLFLVLTGNVIAGRAHCTSASSSVNERRDISIKIRLARQALYRSIIR